MIEKILLCKHPSMENAPSDFLCSAILIFNDNLPIIHAYCEILQKNEDIHIQTTGWSIPNESMIKKIQMYVRNKMDVIKAEKIPTFEESSKQRTAYLRKQGRYFEGDFEANGLRDEQRIITNETDPEIKALEKEYQKQMQSINDDVNKEWT